MPHNLRKWCLLALLALTALTLAAGFALGPDAAQAQTEIVVNPDAQTFSEGNYLCPHNWDGITGRVVVCVQNIIQNAGRGFLQSLLNIYQPIVIAALILATIAYGVLMITGSIRNISGDTFFFIFKVAATVQFSIVLSEWMFEALFGVMEGMLNIVSNYSTVASFSACSDESVMPEIFQLDREQFTVWDKIDCMFINMLGIGVGVGSPIALPALMALLIFTGGIGLVIFLIVVLFIITLLLAVLRSVKIYLMSVIVITFLICISPLIIPLVLFEQTKPYFMNWVKTLANYMIIPIFLVAFLSMMIAAFDAVFFRGSSSLFFIVAGNASQPQAGSDEHHFALGYWLEEGIVADDHNIHQVRNEVEPFLLGGTGGRIPVGASIPGKNAIGILELIATCKEDERYLEGVEDTQRARENLGSTCPEVGGDYSSLYTMLGCALRPVVPVHGADGPAGTDGTCLETVGEVYSGFEVNEEILNFAIAPNIDTDEEIRQQQEEGGCGWNLLCQARAGIGKAAGFTFSVISNVTGAIVRVIGYGLQGLAKQLKFLGSLYEGQCRVLPLPGVICSVTGSVFNIPGNVIHAAGNFVEFSGRIMMNGLLATLGEAFEGWFDVPMLDVQKVAAYHCKYRGTGELANLRNIPPASAYIGADNVLSQVEGEAMYNAYREYLLCDDDVETGRAWGVREFILEILYSAGAALLIGYLLLRWLDYIPVLGKEMIGTAQLLSSVPGEGKISSGARGVRHAFDRMRQRQRGEADDDDDDGGDGASGFARRGGVG